MADFTDPALLILRLVIFVVMFFHGSQKLFGWWDGGGLDKAERFFGSQGYRPARLVATLAAITETGTSILMGLGALTLLAVAGLVGILVNVTVIHLKNGLDRTKHGFEYELMILAGVVTVGLLGPGAWSVDGVVGTNALVGLPPVSVANLIAIGAGILGGLAISATRKKPVPA
jgi:putative oxidoreductase